MRKTTALILSLLAVLNLCWFPAGAADNQAFLGGVSQEEEGQLDLICGIGQEEGDRESFQVLLGSRPVPVIWASTVEEKKLPKTIYCLVDISGSMKGRMEQTKEVLRTISAGLNEEDRLIIGRMGNQITDTGFLTAETAGEEIEKLRYTGEDTDLYTGLIHGLKFLQQQPEVQAVRALVVISDGADDQGAGSTWREAYDAVEKADIPVYTVAPVLSRADYEQAKELGSFARNSAGGVHFPRSDEKGSAPASMTGEEMGEEILSLLGSSFVVRADLTEAVPQDRDTYTISVIFKSQDGKVYEDSKELPAKDIRLPQRETEEETTSEEETDSLQEPESQPVREPDRRSGGPLAGIATGAVVLAAAAVLAVRKKKQKEAERLRLEEEKRQEEERQQEEGRLRQAELEQQDRRRREKEEALKRQQEAAYNALPRLSVRMTALGVRDKTCVIKLVEGIEMTVGRNSKAKIILDSRDTRLSGVHFIMFWDGNSVYVWDGGSKNGTAVNGVVVDHLGRVAVRPGDSLRAGSYEYRLYWED